MGGFEPPNIILVTDNPEYRIGKAAGTAGVEPPDHGIFCLYIKFPLYLLISLLLKMNGTLAQPTFNMLLLASLVLLYGIFTQRSFKKSCEIKKPPDHF